MWLGVVSLVALAAEPAPVGSVGARLAADPEGAVVLYAMPRSPAEAAGLQAEDVIVAVDGAPVVGRPLEDVVATLRGPVGTTVALDLVRDGTTLHVVVRREDLTQGFVALKQIEAEICPAWVEVVRAADDDFRSIRRDLVTSEEAAFGGTIETWSTTVRVPDADVAWIRYTDVPRFQVSYGAFPDAADARIEVQQLARVLRPCFPGWWWVEEHDADGPVWWLGREARDGWYDERGVVRIDGGRVLVTLRGGDPPMLNHAIAGPGDPQAAWARALDPVLAAVADDLDGLRGRRRKRGDVEVFDTTATVPGATACWITDDTFPRFTCTLADGLDAEGATRRIADVAREIGAALGSAWVMRGDADGAEPPGTGIRLVRRTTRGLDVTAVVDLVRVDDRVELRVRKAVLR